MVSFKVLCKSGVVFLFHLLLYTNSFEGFCIQKQPQVYTRGYFYLSTLSPWDSKEDYTI